MKKLLLLFLTLLFTSSNAFCTELQKQYETIRTSKYKDFKIYNATHIVQRDLENYHCHKKSSYGEVIYLINNADETNYRFLLKIKKNYDKCSKDLSCWEYIEIDDYNYSWLDNATKNVVWFNNIIFLKK